MCVLVPWNGFGGSQQTSPGQQLRAVGKGGASRVLIGPATLVAPRAIVVRGASINAEAPRVGRIRSGPDVEGAEAAVATLTFLAE